MLCGPCKSLSFSLTIPKHKNRLFAVLHQKESSFRASVTFGCDLCLIISGKLGNIQGHDEACEHLDAFVVLSCFVKHIHGYSGSAADDVSSVIVMSPIGTATLDIIGPIPDAYSFLYPKSRRSSARQSSTHARKRQKIDEALQTNRNDSTGSPQNLQLAETWLRECRRQHSHCKVNHTSSAKIQLPTRLINIGEVNRPFLEEIDPSTKGFYVALSYSWGNGERVQTLQANYQDHLLTLPVKTLPKTFVDAIKIAREMKYKYLWIDAFCITQDDNDDLSRELPKMGSIYRYADFTIYAQSSNSSHAGIFVRRDYRYHRPCEAIMTTKLNGDTSTKKVTFATTSNGSDYLKSRGWILQERVLSSRCLILGQQMAWICSEGEAQETNPVLRLKPKYAQNSDLWILEALRSSLYSTSRQIEGPRDPQRQPSKFDLWYKMLEEYSDRQLSFVSDNLKAVSGLAALFQETHSVSFIMGLWKEDLQFGLGWYVNMNDERPVPKKIEGPSWSWPSVGKVRIRFRSWRSTIGPSSGVGCELIDVAYDARAMPNPFASIDKAVLSLRAPVRRAFLQQSDSFSKARYARCYGRPGPEFGGIDTREEPRYPVLLLHPDTKKPIGEVALDRAISSTSADPISSCITGGVTLEVWCILLHTQQTRDGCRGTLLVVDKVKTKAKLFKRIGLGFVVGEYMCWFGIQHKDPEWQLNKSLRKMKKEVIQVM